MNTNENPIPTSDANIPAPLHDPNIHVTELPPVPIFRATDDEDPAEIEAFEKKLAEELERKHAEDLRTLKYPWYTLAQLRTTDYTQEFLLEHFLPRIGVGAVVGMPDSDKSMLCRHLALAVAMHQPEFCGLRLQKKHHHAIFVTTEDTREATKTCFIRQADALIPGGGKQWEQNLKIVIADDMTTDEIMETLDQLLREYPSDLVVIDAYGDVFKGGEGNSNIANRNSVRPFSHIASAFETCVLFVHHTNKSARNFSPNHVHVQGGSGFVQKVRSILELRSAGDNNLKYLTCVKGNSTSQERKSEALKLKFSPDTFLYQDTGERMPVEYITTERTSRSKLEIKPKDIFPWGKETMAVAEIIEKICLREKCSKRSARRWVDGNLETVEHGIYKNPTMQ